MASLKQVELAFDQLPRFNRLTEQLQALSDDYSRRLAVAERLIQQRNSAEMQKATQMTGLETAEKAQQILLALEDIWRKDFEKSIEEIVGEGLRLVFGDDTDFIVETKTERGASAIDFVIETNQGEVDPDAEGGSFIQVVSFLLRLIFIKAHRPALRQVVVLDESLNAVSEEYQEATAQLLRKMVDESGVQIILVTHNRIFTEYADVVYEVTKTKGVGHVKRL